MCHIPLGLELGRVRCLDENPNPNPILVITGSCRDLGVANLSGVPVCWGGVGVISPCPHPITIDCILGVRLV